jgi:hypothetical protein
MRIEFDTENPQDVERVKQLLGMTVPAVPVSTDTPDYAAFINERGATPQRRPFMIDFIRQAKQAFGLQSELQAPSSRVTLKAGITPVVHVWTSGRAMFRVAEGTTTGQRYAQTTSASDTNVGWPVQVYLDSEKHVEAALELAREAAAPMSNGLA